MLSLEPVLRCPARQCGRVLIDVELELGSTTALRCPRKKCRSHWWATHLEAGNIRQQLLDDFEDETVVDQLMGVFGLPLTIDRPMYWQVWLTGEEFHGFNKTKTAGGRTVALFRNLLTLPRRAS